LAELEAAREELGRRINKVISPGKGHQVFERKLEREADERDFDEMGQLLGQIRLELLLRRARGMK
jgi:hypothetical protein